jgi:hypothetical protein
LISDERGTHAVPITDPLYADYGARPPRRPSVHRLECDTVPVKPPRRPAEEETQQVGTRTPRVAAALQQAAQQQLAARRLDRRRRLRRQYAALATAAGWVLIAWGATLWFATGGDWGWAGLVVAGTAVASLGLWLHTRSARKPAP